MSLLSKWASVRRTLPLVLGTAALVLVWGRFVIEGRRAVREAQVAVEAGDRAEAVRSYLDALRVYVPGSPYERRALDGLDALAMAARDAGDEAGERHALQAIRTGLLGTRGLFVPHRARLMTVEARLHELGEATGLAPTEPMVAGARLRGEAAAYGAGVLSTLIALVGLATWMSAVALMVRNALHERAHTPATGTDRTVSSSVPASHPARGLGVLVPVLFAAGVALFLIGLRFS